MIECSISITISPRRFFTSWRMLEEAPVGPAVRGARVEHGRAAGEQVAGPDRPSPLQPVDAGRAHRGRIVQPAVATMRMKSAQVCQPDAASPPSSRSAAARSSRWKAAGRTPRQTPRSPRARRGRSGSGRTSPTAKSSKVRLVMSFNSVGMLRYRGWPADINASGGRAIRLDSRFGHAPPGFRFPSRLPRAIGCLTPRAGALRAGRRACRRLEHIDGDDLVRRRRLRADYAADVRRALRLPLSSGTVVASLVLPPGWCSIGRCRSEIAR